MNRLVSVTDRDGEITAYTYDANGNRSSLTYPNGNKTTYTYDHCNRLVSLVITDRYSNIIERYDYTLGTAGERLSVQETNRTIHYSYDDLYRLTQETIQDGALDLTIDYTYDAVGNRLTQTDLTGTTVYTYNALNQLILENDTVYTYDDNGSLISVSGPDRSAEYTYNDLGRMSTATVTTGTTTVTESYLYDWAGTRTAKITDGVLTYYLVDTGGVLSQVLAELDHTGALITHYTRGEEIISLSRPGEKHYYLHDGHGSVRALSDADGQVTDTYLFDAFGNLLSKTGTTENDFLYTGEQYDANTGFYYLRARYMNPSTGTFTSPDAYVGSIFDPVSLHKYLYANANPVMNRDPSGYYTLADVGTAMVINAVISSAVNAVIGFTISSLEYLTHGGDFFSYGHINASMNGFWTGALWGFVFGILGQVLNVFLFSIILVTLSFFTIQYGWERYKSGDHVWGFVYIGIGIIVACGTIFNLVRVLKPYISGGSKGNKPVGDQGKKSDGDPTGVKDNGSTKANTGRAKNKIQPDKNAEGAHTVIKRDPKTGEITNYRTYEPNPQNPSGFDEVSGYDGVGGYHTNKVTGEQFMPHVHDKTVPGGVRAPSADEIPGYMEEY